MANPDYSIQLNTIGNTITGITLEDNLFKHHAPKPKGIKAVKLTEENMDAVAKRLRQVLSSQHDEVSVTVSEDRIRATYSLGIGMTFFVDHWIVEGFDYQNDKVTFTRASTEVREKHDLR